MSGLRMSSYYDLPPQPPWLRRMQIVTVLGMVVAVALQFCRLAFGLWAHRIWIDIFGLMLQIAFVVGQVLVIRWNRSLKQ